jgi:TPR repeat protein
MITTYHLRQLAGEGDSDAQFRLAYRLAFGRRRVSSAWSRAARWWALAAAQGHPRAQFYLGTCYDQGRGVRKNLVKAMRLYRSAGDQGHVEGQ